MDYWSFGQIEKNFGLGFCLMVYNVCRRSRYCDFFKCLQGWKCSCYLLFLSISIGRDGLFCSVSYSEDVFVDLFLV